MTPSTEHTVAPDAITRTTWTIASLVVAGAFMTQLDAALLQVSLDKLSSDLDVAVSSGQWSVSAYLLATGIGMPASAWLCRKFGAGRTWWWCVLAFVAASALCALSPSLGWLVAMRALQGLAAGGMLPAGQTCIVQAAGPKAIGRVMATAGTALVFAPALGPVLGGWMMTHYPWPWLFLINIPVGCVVLLTARRVRLPDSTAPHGRFPAADFVFTASALTLLTLGLGDLADLRILNGVSFVAGAALCMALFVSRSRRGNVLLDVRLFKHPVFAIASAVGFLAGATQFGTLILVPLHLQKAHGWSALDAGYAMVAFAIGSAALVFTGKYVDKYGGAVVVLCGAAVTVVASALLALSSDRVAVVELSLVMLGIGMALSIVPSATASYRAVAKESMPDAVAFNNIVLRVGGAIGSCVLVVLFERLGAPSNVPFAVLFGMTVLLLVCAVLLSVNTRNEERKLR